ncbi:MAG: inosine monophosphate cyclohydrolase, partial [Clostridiales bacterium]|nr:inosine monophosphate cyclohydrolase [Clostridiales bacterium]
VDAGQGYFISTYQGDGSPLPTFAGEPLEVTVPTPEEVWQALNADNKVSLYTSVNGEVRLFNKNLGD